MTAIVASIRRPNNFGCVVTKEVLTRLMAHICFCKGKVLSNEQVDKTIKLMNTLAFTYIPGDKSAGSELSKEQLTARNQVQQDQMKIQKAAINCLTNIYNRNESPESAPMQAALKECSVETFKLLKETFVYLVRKI